MENITVEQDGDGGVIIGARKVFEQNEALNLAETSKEWIDSAIIDIYLGKVDSQPGGPVYKTIRDGVGFNLQLISDVHKDELGKIKDPDAALRVAESTLSELRHWYDADNKDGGQEDNGSIIWTSNIQQGDRKARLSIIEKRGQPKDGELGELPISATAYIQKLGKQQRWSQKLHDQPKHPSTVTRIRRVIKGWFALYP